MAAESNRARRSLLTWRNTERVALLLLWLAIMVVSALGYWGRDDWRFDLLANFKMQYYLGALVLCVIAAWRRFRVVLALGVVALLWNGWEIFNFAPQSVEPQNWQIYRAVSANVYTKNTHIDRVESWIREQEPDFVALIEITGQWKPALERLSDILPYQQKQMWGNRYGSVVLSKYPPIKPQQSFGYPGVGSVPLQVMTPDGPLTVLLIHPLSPTNERSWEWRGNALKDIANYAVAANKEMPVLALGDMNTTPWSPFYKDFVLQSELELVATGFLPRRTWPTRNPLLWIPIDHFFLSQQLGPVDQWTGPDLGSDHYPIALDFCFAPQSE